MGCCPSPRACFSATIMGWIMIAVFLLSYVSLLSFSHKRLICIFTAMIALANDARITSSLWNTWGTWLHVEKQGSLSRSLRSSKRSFLPWRRKDAYSDQRAVEDGPASLEVSPCSYKRGSVHIVLLSIRECRGSVSLYKRFEACFFPISEDV